MFTMFSPDSPDLRNPVFLFVLKLIHKVFGHVQWQAPGWIPWTGLQLRKAAGYLTAGRRRRTITVLSLFAIATAFTWYEARPRPHYVEYTVTAPKLTEYDANGISSIYPLAVNFEEPVAPLANLDKRLVTGIDISPAFAGTWTWLDDKRLQFAPKSDWPVDASFTVKIGRKGFLARTVELDDYSFKFRTQPFSAKITSSQFYQDPQNPTLKKPGRHGGLQPPRGYDAVRAPRLAHPRQGRGLPRTRFRQQALHGGL